MRRTRSKNATRAAALMLSAALLSCGDDTPAQQRTGLRVEIQFDPGTYTVDRFRLEGYDAEDGTEIFEPGSLPLEVGEPFDSGRETAVILLSDALGGQEVLIKVWGEHQGEIQAFGSATAVIERGAVVEVQVVLGDPPVCGNGEVHPIEEQCDTAIATGEPGACPTAGDCSDGDPCTADRLLGEGTCLARCESVIIDTCAHGDGCCPVGCAPATDSDCSAVCGDGLIGAGEQCDTGIPPGDPGSCPTACADQNPCTEDTLVSAGSCTAHCEFPVITDFLGGDGCCPQGGDATVDSDCPEVCGNGVVEPSEQCDTAIGAGQTGACPQTTADCDDSDPCTTDSLASAGTCQAHCDHETVTALQDGDGCCPAGGSSLTDDDCPVACGNGAVEAGETCDTGIASGSPGACPTAADCDDQLSCTIDSVVNDGTCQAECDHQAISACSGGDGCCPSGCDPSSDSDCQGVCGDGTLDGGETCDTGIASGNTGACPTASDCDDGDPCTVDTVVGDGTCQAYCDNEPVSCVDGDGCCPTGCDNNTDDDCSAVCGNGVVEPGGGELCDTGISSGDPGACPTASDCDDGDPCTDDALQNGGTCQAECTHDEITAFVDGDGCCPAGGDQTLDNDCPAVCGNGVVESGETCDTAIDTGDPGACPTAADCDDNDPCTQDTVANDGTCQAECSNQTITACSGGDGCCPGGCDARNDSDCPGCGNGVNEPTLGEECDDGNGDSLDGCTTSCTLQTGAVGDPCATNADCNSASGLVCLTSASFGLPGGYCSATGCDMVATPCPVGASCVTALVSNQSACAEICLDDEACRWYEGYSCQSVSGSDKVCLP